MDPNRFGKDDCRKKTCLLKATYIDALDRDYITAYIEVRDIVEILERRGADTNAVLDHDKTAVTIAVLLRNEEVAKFLAFYYYPK